MKKQKTEQQNADEILRQLQKSYLDDSPTDPESEPVKEDADDLAFSRRISDFFKRFSVGRDAKKATRKKAKQSAPEPVAEEPMPIAEEPEPVEEEPIPIAE